jgi:GT2 family glycosyltransferase
VLHYPDKRIQHAGIVVGIGGTAGHPFKTFPGDNIGYFARLTLTSNVSAVTGALLMVSKSKYLQVDGLDESNFAVALNDVDFCLKLSDAGYRNVMTADCHGIHDESASRGTEYSGSRQQRYEKEVQRFRDKWANFLDQGDPYYNRNLTLESEDYTLRWSAGN